jgi:tetratricopeptide (TPR) repeat protein
LSVSTRTESPVAWAKTQNNLGNALYSLGARREDLGLLRQSITALEAALTVFTPEAEPLRWATVINNIAASQTQIATVTYAATSDAEMAASMRGISDPTNIPEVVAAREAANAALDAGIAATRSAASDALRSRDPLDWAMLEHTLATALLERGEINHDAGAIRDGIAAYRAVLAVHTRTQMPAQWVRTSNNLAIALKNLSDETSDPAPLREAVGVYKDVVSAIPREDTPLDWADYQENLGNALAVLADYDQNPSLLAEAMVAYRAASEVTTIARGVAKWQQLRIAMSTTLLMESLTGRDRSKALEARAMAEETRDVVKAHGAPTDFFDAYLPQVDKVIGLFPQ